LETVVLNADEVVISGTLQPVSRTASPVLVEVYNQSFFLKNPTPSLLEGLQYVNGVRPQINCNVCNTGDIHINGMEGPYTLVLIDGMPIVSGLGSVYGLSGIPVSLLQRVEVIRGPAGALYGSEAVGGLINVITRSPDQAPAFSAEAWGSTWSEWQADLGLRRQWKKTSTLLGVHYFQFQQPHDRNGDGFTDAALQQRVSVFNKWSRSLPGQRSLNLIARYVWEDRWGGQLAWEPAFRGGDSVYGESIYTRRAELIGTWDLGRGFRADLSASDHRQDAAYGTTPYIADQQIGFGQVRWSGVQHQHTLLAGLACRWQRYDDNSPATETATHNAPDLSWLPGGFVQDEWQVSSRLQVLSGARLDFHNRHGWVFSPRLNLKWTPGDLTTLRLSGGNGFRVVNLFTEEHAALSGAREVLIREALRPETSWNTTLAWQQFLMLPDAVLELNTSAFYTWFSNKIVPDYETDSDLIIYDNLPGDAVVRGVSAEAQLRFTFPLQVQVGVTWQDVFLRDEMGLKTSQLLTERLSGSFAISWTWTRAGLSLDYTGNVVGPMRLPVVPNDTRPEYSTAYSLQNIQATKVLPHGFELFGGVKNLLDFTLPEYAILRAFDPFDKTAADPVTNPYGFTFDPSYAWAPNQGIRAYLGVRWRLP
jgi:outer membrane receptor for ferrienterochelin and colicins